MREFVLRSLPLALAAVFLVSCSSPTAAPAALTPGALGSTSDQAYPAASPAFTAEAYPNLTTDVPPTLPPGEQPFALDRPLLAGATAVTGSGTAGAPIILHNVTFMGEVMGQATVGEDGRFTVSVPPLEANVRVGVGLGDLSGTRWTPDYFLAPGFQGEGALSLPNVGYFLDTVQVSPP